MKNETPETFLETLVQLQEAWVALPEACTHARTHTLHAFRDLACAARHGWHIVGHLGSATSHVAYASSDFYTYVLELIDKINPYEEKPEQSDIVEA
jgi:hypothetical protein